MHGDLTLTGPRLIRPSVGWRREELSCTAMIGSSSGKTVLKRLVVAAEFIRPVIEFSRREIKFERKRIPGVEFTQQMAGQSAVH